MTSQSGKRRFGIMDTHGSPHYQRGTHRPHGEPQHEEACPSMGVGLASRREPSVAPALRDLPNLFDLYAKVWHHGPACFCLCVNASVGGDCFASRLGF